MSVENVLRRPARLVPGDRVAIVATSGPLPPDRLARGVAILESWGLDVRLGRHALQTDAEFPHLAGTDRQRAEDFQDAWCDPGVRAVFVGRGGSGAARISDRLDWVRMRNAGPKVLVGFSDVTTLHQAVGTFLGLVSLFGPMPATVAFGAEVPDADTVDHLRRTLFEPDTVRTLSARDGECVVPGQAEGPLTGGTVSVLAGSVGARELRPARGAIAVLEDVAEPAYRLDGNLTQLLRAGWFDGVRGVVLGSWTGCGDAAADVVAARLRHLDVPLLTGLPIGHCVPALTVAWGVKAALDSRAGTVNLVEPALGPSPGQLSDPA